MKRCRNDDTALTSEYKTCMQCSRMDANQDITRACGGDSLYQATLGATMKERAENKEEQD